MHYPLHDDVRPEPATDLNPWGSDRARVISIVSQKGGVGKTTSTINLGACFALTGHRVLIIGTDPQCGVSRSLGYGPQQLRGGLREVIISGLPLTHVAHETALDTMSMVAPDAWTLAEEEQYKDLMARHAMTFVNAVTEARKEFDTILIDCPPGFGPETRAALLASNGYLVPVQAEELCRDSLTRLMHFIDDYRLAHRPQLALMGLFLTMTDHRTRMSRQVAARLDEDYGDRLLDNSIPRNTRLTEMALQGKPTVIYDRMSSGSRAYFNIMDEIVLRHLHLEQQPAESAVLPETSPESGVDDNSEAEIFVESGSSVHPDGLARLMRELGSATIDTPDNLGGSTAETDLYDNRESDYDDGGNGEVDMVSLDDLIEEEERTEEGRNNESGWGYGDDNYETIN
jgi:chromosome partitioning protein